MCPGGIGRFAWGCDGCFQGRMGESGETVMVIFPTQLKLFLPTTHDLSKN